MFSHFRSPYRHLLATIVLTSSLMLALVWMLTSTKSVARALPNDPDLHAPGSPLVPNSIFTVTNANDDGPGSLRQAIADATDGTIINFDNSYAIYLSSTLEITKLLTIDGGNNTITVSGDSLNNGTPDVQAINIGNTGILTLSHLIVASGTAVNGGGIYNSGILHLTASAIANSSATNGGGIFNAGTLDAQESVIHYNAAVGSGCGIYNAGAATLSSSAVNNNYAPDPIGGGIYNAGQLHLVSSTVAYNSGMAYGNIWNNGGTLYLMGSSVSNGSSTVGGNAIANENGGLVYIQDSQIKDNPGAIDTTNSTLIVVNSVIMNNASAYWGGGIKAVNSTVTLSNTTLSGNSAGTGGGLVSDASTINLNNVTIANNWTGSSEGGGIYISSGNVNARNTIIADNHGTGSGTPVADCYGTLNSLGYNLVGDTTGCVISGTLTGVITNAAPLLGPLQDNGGPTWTMALLPNSPAIDSGDDASCLPTDQRGTTRPQGAHCDIGAFEGIYAYIYLPLLTK